MKLPTLLMFFTFQATLSVCQISFKDIALEDGIYKVGFRHYLSYDNTRTYQRIFDWNNEFIPRPIPVSIWYPSTALPDHREQMTVLDYMEILKEEEEWEYLPNEQILNWFYYQNTSTNREHLEDSTMALLEGQVFNGKFPAIVYAPSYQASSIENFGLCEYLASHGYIVISSPSRGAENKFLEGGTEKDMEAQARDIEFLIGELAKFQNSNDDLIATMGFSFGGLSNVLSQMRNDNIKAIISLDGSIKYQYSTLKKSPFAEIDLVDVPFIHMAQKDIPEQVLIEDKIDPELNSKFEFYDSLVNSKAFSLKFHNLTHSYFSTLGVLFQTRDYRQDKSDPEIAESYKWASVYTLNFLNAYLKEDQAALKFLENDPEENGIRASLISKRFKDAKLKPIKFQDFNVLAGEQNYENLEELYKSLREKYPSLILPEGSLNNLGLQLIFNSETSAKGVNVLLLATTIYPKSANLFDSLAEGYLHIGEKEKAIEYFEKSLGLNKQNQNAIQRLKELK